MPVTADEQAARELLRSVVGDHDAEVYEAFGLLVVEDAGGEYGYLIYPQRPVVSYDARSGEVLSEYCVRFLDSEERLPDADDVLAKWLALRMDERQTLGTANVHPLGRQLDPEMVRRDLAALRAWRGAVA